jgi:hypothetical protein
LLGEHKLDEHKDQAHGEYQVGLQMMAKETDPWGLSGTHSKTHPVTKAAVVSAAA